MSYRTAIVSVLHGTFNSRAGYRSTCIKNSPEFSPLHSLESTIYRFEVIDSSVYGRLPNLYLHSKTGNVYQIVGQSLDSEGSNDGYVQYSRFTTDSTIWTRRASSFFGLVTDPEGKEVPRFKRIYEDRE
jgi:hypothetical protein